MPASKETVVEVIHAIEEWRRDKALSKEDTQELLNRLTAIPGNDSFKITMHSINLGYQALTGTL